MSHEEGFDWRIRIRGMTEEEVCLKLEALEARAEKAEAESEHWQTAWACAVEREDRLRAERDELKARGVELVTLLHERQAERDRLAKLAEHYRLALAEIAECYRPSEVGCETVGDIARRALEDGK